MKVHTGLSPPQVLLLLFLIVFILCAQLGLVWLRGIGEVLRGRDFRGLGESLCFTQSSQIPGVLLPLVPRGGFWNTWIGRDWRGTEGIGLSKPLLPNGRPRICGVSGPPGDFPLKTSPIPPCQTRPKWPIFTKVALKWHRVSLVSS